MFYYFQCTRHPCIHHVDLYDGQCCALYFTVPDAARVTAGYLMLLGWISSIFFREPAKRAVAITLMNVLGQTANIVGSSVTWSSISCSRYLFTTALVSPIVISISSEWWLC